MRQPQSAYANLIIRQLAPTDFAALEPLLELVGLDYRMELERPNERIDRVCFPERGIISLVALAPGLNTIEAALIGVEGMTGSAVIMGETQSPLKTHVQVQGVGHWVDASALRKLLRQLPSLHQTMLTYVLALSNQIAQTGLVNGRAVIDVRLARWLLMAADRVGDDDMPLTHDLLAVMLGVRRPGVTDALHRLEGNLLIRARRASVSIRNREALEAFAGGAYGIAEAEYHRLLGVDPGNCFSTVADTSVAIAA